MTCLGCQWCEGASGLTAPDAYESVEELRVALRRTMTVRFNHCLTRNSNRLIEWRDVVDEYSVFRCDNITSCFTEVSSDYLEHYVRLENPFDTGQIADEARSFARQHLRGSMTVIRQGVDEFRGHWIRTYVYHAHFDDLNDAILFRMLVGH